MRLVVLVHLKGLWDCRTKIMLVVPVFRFNLRLCILYAIFSIFILFEDFGLLFADLYSLNCLVLD